MIDIKLLGPSGDQYAQFSRNGSWLATTKAEYAEAVKSALDAALANGNYQRESAVVQPACGTDMDAAKAQEQSDSHQHSCD